MSDAPLRVFADTRGHARCRSCGADILWYELTSGKRHPFNLKDFAPLVAESEYEAGGTGRKILHVSRDLSHFATCPDAKKWSRPAAKPRAPRI